MASKSIPKSPGIIDLDDISLGIIDFTYYNVYDIGNQVEVESCKNSTYCIIGFDDILFEFYYMVLEHTI
jgi:hypothetical protein